MTIDPPQEGPAQVGFIHLVTRLDLGGHELRRSREIDRARVLRVHPMGGVAALSSLAAERAAAVLSDVGLFLDNGIEEPAAIARHDLEQLHDAPPDSLRDGSIARQR